MIPRIQVAMMTSTRVPPFYDRERIADFDTLVLMPFLAENPFDSDPIFIL
jgi:hypothetical protein